jgi:Protein of unknown function (DUF3223)
MGKRKPLLIGRIAFDTQSEAREFIQRILDTTTWREPLKDDTHEFVLSLLERHPNAAEKIFGGISHFTAASSSITPMEAETTSATLSRSRVEMMSGHWSLEPYAVR